jgi:hypothetical protein
VLNLSIHIYTNITLNIYIYTDIFTYLLCSVRSLYNIGVKTSEFLAMHVVSMQVNEVNQQMNFVSPETQFTAIVSNTISYLLI